MAGPDALYLHTRVPTRGEGLTTVADFTVSAGDRISFALTWSPSNVPFSTPADAERSLADTEQYWKEWSARCAYEGPYREQVLRSLITLKALTYAPTGGIVAAPTTSLPEALGGVRNWDYRYCWLRDATFTLYSLMAAGYRDEARAWRDWLLRAMAGDPAQLQIMYGPGGERRLTELVLEWLPGYEGSAPVRIGNAAVHQLQLDVYGEVMDSLHQSRPVGIESDEYSWPLQQHLLEYLETGWTQPDEGIWEVRGPPPALHALQGDGVGRHGPRGAGIETFGLPGDVERWKRLRAAIHEEVCAKGYDATRQAFVQYYGGKELDASLLMVPLVGFLPPEDERVRGTVKAI